MDIACNGTYRMPAVTLIGRDCLRNLGGYMKACGAQKALLVTDGFMCKAGYAEKVAAVLNEQGVGSAVFDGVKANPTIQVVCKAAGRFWEDSCNAVVSIGGGSAHDTAKAVKLAAKKAKLPGTSSVPLACVNTTAGTASEMTQYCIITDEETHRKLAVINQDTVPDIAVDDPVLMVGMPPSLTAATGMDALTHAIEAYTACGHNELTDCTALRAARLIFENLCLCYRDGQNIAAREKMAFAQYMAGMAFSNAGLGLAHAMAHSLGGLYNLPHGMCNAVLLPFVMRFNLDVNAGRYAIMAREACLAAQGMPDEFCANRLIRKVEEVLVQLKIPGSLKQMGVKPEDFETLSEMTLSDFCFRANAKPASKEEVIRIYDSAYAGERQLSRTAARHAGST